MGDLTDFSRFMGAVIDDRAFAKHRKAIARVRANKPLTLLAGGQTDDSVGYFVRPTIVVPTDPTDQIFSDEYFGPILAVHVYEDDRFEKVVDQRESFAPYALTGAIIAQDCSAGACARVRCLCDLGALTAPLPEPAVLNYGLRAVLSPSSPFYVPLRLDPRLLRFFAGFARNSTARRWGVGMRAYAPLNRRALAAYDGGVEASTHPAELFLACFSTPEERAPLLEELEHIQAVGQDVK